MPFLDGGLSQKDIGPMTVVSVLVWEVIDLLAPSQCGLLLPLDVFITKP